MRYLIPLLFCVLLAPAASAQSKVMPVVPFGGIYDMPEVTVKPDPALEYRLVIDVVSGADHADSLAAGLYNVARMLNLFSVGGVPDEQVDVVLSIHGGATVAVLDDLSYRQRFGTDNPNLPLIRALKGAGVRVTVCGQSLIGRTIDPASVTEEVEIATSMLTTVAMYQMRGYGMMKF